VERSGERKYKRAETSLVVDAKKIFRKNLCAPIKMSKARILGEKQFDRQFYCEQPAPASAPQDAISWGAAF
jgi:hypothetical protein